MLDLLISVILRDSSRPNTRWAFCLSAKIVSAPPGVDLGGLKEAEGSPRTTNPMCWILRQTLQEPASHSTAWLLSKGGGINLIHWDLATNLTIFFLSNCLPCSFAQASFACLFFTSIQLHLPLTLNIFMNNMQWLTKIVLILPNDNLKLTDCLSIPLSWASGGSNSWSRSMFFRARIWTAWPSDPFYFLHFFADFPCATPITFGTFLALICADGP